MTQPAVSQYIQNLERKLGTKLLDRSNNKYIQLTKGVPNFFGKPI
ncbi:LysR family transcriptional regulator [Pelosinus sp. IPA-1]